MVTGMATGMAAGAGAAKAVLVFDAAGRLTGWTAEAAALPGAAAVLRPGAAAASLSALFDGAETRDTPLNGGGFLRQAAPAGQGAGRDGARPFDPASRLFAAASHDLRQPLAALSLLLGTLDARVAEPGSRDLLKAMGNAVQSMKSMVDGHFDLVRLEAGLLEPDIGEHAVNGILMRLALDVAPRFEDRGLRFSVLPCSAMIRTDPVLLERMLHGLVANALRYTARGHVVLGCRRRGEHLRIEVWDTGRGLSPERLERLRGELENGRPEREGDGRRVLGLGLSLARGLAGRLGHRVEVCSEEGRGSLFTVIVPRAPESADGAPVRLPDIEAEADVSRARVLLIEDDPMVLSALDALLGQWGCAVTGVESYDAALERFGSGQARPDLVIADLRLRGAANGIVAIRQLAKALDTELPGLILTGDTDPMRLREARLSGYPLLHKPVAPLALRAAVGRLLGGERLMP
nr:hybrid sensor histidine kinase/response regulator [Azospirillum sp. SYSU D00513]